MWLDCRLLAGQSSVCLNALICSSTLLSMDAWERLTELCAIPACEHLLCIIKTMLTKCYWSSIFSKSQSTFSTVFLTCIIGTIIVKYEFMTNISGKMSVFITAHAYYAAVAAIFFYYADIYIFMKNSFILLIVILYSFQIQFYIEYIIINIVFMNLKHFYW